MIVTCFIGSDGSSCLVNNVTEDYGCITQLLSTQTLHTPSPVCRTKEKKKVNPLPDENPHISPEATNTVAPVFV